MIRRVTLFATLVFFVITLFPTVWTEPKATAQTNETVREDQSISAAESDDGSVSAAVVFGDPWGSWWNISVQDSISYPGATCYANGDVDIVGPWIYGSTVWNQHGARVTAYVLAPLSNGDFEILGSHAYVGYLGRYYSNPTQFSDTYGKIFIDASRRVQTFVLVEVLWYGRYDTSLTSPIGGVSYVLDYYYDARDQNVYDWCYYPELIPTVTNTPTNEPTATNTLTNEPTVTKTVTSAATRTSTPQPTRTPTKKPTATKTPTLKPTKTPTKKPTVTKTPTKKPATKTPTRGPSKTATKSATKTPTRSATRTPTRAASRTPTKSATRTPTRTPTRSVALIPSSTPTATSTSTYTPLPAGTSTPTLTPES